jgi:hypothetical protein
VVVLGKVVYAKSLGRQCLQNEKQQAYAVFRPTSFLASKIEIF